ncbi:MAG: DUF3617 domain-containing protein [Sphingomonadales bacterium]|nr:DUF3617 domain-containing protein [Sphingomonadales bacterium]
MGGASKALAIAALAGGLALAGCHRQGQPSGGVSASGSAASVAAVAAAQIHPRPGRWETTVTVTHIDMPGMPAEMAAAMQQHMGRGVTAAHCLTRAEADKPAAGMFTGRGNDCTYDKFTMAGGRIDAVMHCSAGASQMQMTMTGTYDDSHFTGSMHNATSMPGGRTMQEDVTTSSRWAGACNGSEASAGGAGG